MALAKNKKFLDSNIFIYAYYIPKRRLSETEQKMKILSKNVITNISLGKEFVITTVVHISEVANILKHSFSPQELSEVIHAIFDHADVLGVSREEYLAASELARELDMDPNDSLACQMMRTNGVSKIYSFDRVFDRIQGIERIPVLQ